MAFNADPVVNVLAGPRSAERLVNTDALYSVLGANPETRMVLVVLVNNRTSDIPLTVDTILRVNSVAPGTWLHITLNVVRRPVAPLAGLVINVIFEASVTVNDLVSPQFWVNSVLTLL
jgi:hypothetical protein